MARPNLTKEQRIKLALITFSNQIERSMKGVRLCGESFEKAAPVFETFAKALKSKPQSS